MSVLKKRINDLNDKCNDLKRNNVGNNLKMDKILQQNSSSLGIPNVGDILKTKNLRKQIIDNNKAIEKIKKMLGFLNHCLDTNNNDFDFIMPMDNKAKSILGNEFIKTYAHGKIEYINKNNLKTIKTSEVFLNE